MFPERPTATNVLFPKVTPLRLFAVGEVALTKDEPLSVDLTMFPGAPTATNVLFPEVTPQRELVVGEVTEVHEFPEFPTDKQLIGLTFGNNTFVGVGTYGNIVRSTDNGTTWDNVTSPTAESLKGVGFLE